MKGVIVKMKFTVKGLTFLGLKKGVSQKTQKEYSIVSLFYVSNYKILFLQHCKFCLFLRYKLHNMLHMF